MTFFDMKAPGMPKDSVKYTLLLIVALLVLGLAYKYKIIQYES